MSFEKTKESIEKLTSMDVITLELLFDMLVKVSQDVMDYNNTAELPVINREILLKNLHAIMQMALSAYNNNREGLLAFSVTEREEYTKQIDEINRIVSQVSETNEEIRKAEEKKRELHARRLELQEARGRLIAVTEENEALQHQTDVLSELVLKSQNAEDCNRAVSENEIINENTSISSSANSGFLAPFNSKDFSIEGNTLVKYKGHDRVVNVPYGIQIIGKRAFSDNVHIEEVDLPDSVQKIKEYAFYRCRYLKKVDLPAELNELGEWAFAYSGIKNILIPPKVKSFGSWVFYYSALENAVVSGSVEIIPYGTFEDCRLLSEVVFKEGIAVIEEKALDGCPNLKTITIPDTLERIGADVSSKRWFIGTNNIQVVNAGERWKKEYSQYYIEMIPAANESDNFLIDGNTLVRYFGRESKPVIPQGINYIGEYAFYENEHIREIVIPEGVKVIEKSAFWGCESLRRLSLPESLLYIRDHAFAFTGIDSLTIPKRVREIEGNAFCNCKSLREISFIDSFYSAVQNKPSVAQNAFEDCSGIQTINASESWKQRNRELVSRLLKQK